jgi:anion-transporting  ArsA/GET3 family ATPase
MASVYDQWIDKITGLRAEMEEYSRVASVMKREKESEEDQILKELQFIKYRINTSSSILTDKLKHFLCGNSRRDDHFGYRKQPGCSPSSMSPFPGISSTG